jgi:hypothetical protein
MPWINKGKHAMKRNKSLILPIIALLCLLTGCTSSATPASSTVTPSSQARQTATLPPARTVVPAGTILYQANWSHGLGGWQAAKGWQVAGGQLLVNSIPETTIMAPYRPAAPNYAVEVRIQLVRVLKQSANFYYIFANGAPNQDGFDAGAVGLTASANGLPDSYAGYTQAAPDSLDGSKGFNSSDFVPGFGWRTFRAEVKGDQLNFYVDGVRISSTYSTKPAISTGPLGLDTQGLALRVSSFIITAL